MNTFISEIVDYVLGQIDEPGQVTVVFPNRRAGLFFTKELSKRIDKPIWMPKVSSFEDFVLSFSNLDKIDTLEGVFRLYESYRQINPKTESFDKFFFWGEMILRDFEEIDQYLAKGDQVFTSIESEKEIDEQFFFLDPEDRKIIESFWNTFLPKTTRTQDAFIETWKILKPVYDAFSSELLRLGKGYGGLIYREFLKQLDELPIEDGEVIIFAGFNALTAAEEKIISHFIDNQRAQIFWDYDDYYFSNPMQEAGFFLRQYVNKRVFNESFKKSTPTNLKGPKSIRATGVSLEVGQAKAMSEDLDQLLKSENFDPAETVIVLPKEHMMFPVLNAIPKDIESVNITMGYPLKDTPVFQLIDSMLWLQSTRRESVVHGSSFYNKPLIELMENPLLAVFSKQKLVEFMEQMKRRNLIYVYLDEIPIVDPVFELIFSKPTNPLSFLRVVLKALFDSGKWTIGALELEYITRFYDHVFRLESMIGERSEGLSYEFLIRFFRRLSKSLKIPFTGEPLAGLQVMGILETRNLDFKNVFILNMNEDSWPAPLRRGSFIPYSVRRAFGLPVHDHQDAIYSYLFYRLIQRAENVHFYYNTVSEFNVNGEISRLVQQLDFESGFEIKRRILANPIKVSKPEPIVIEKDGRILERMKRFTPDAQKWRSRLSPSALNTYLHCRLQFYFRYVEQLYEAEELQEDLDAMVFGNILHDSMEILYSQFTKTQKTDIIQPSDFFWLEQGIDGAVLKAFIKHYDVKNVSKFKYEGRNAIAARMIIKMIKTIFRHDQQYAPFKIIGLETDTKDGYTLDFKVPVNDTVVTIGLKGKIDRIDLKQGKIRVIDYKTGKDQKSYTTIESLVDREDKDRNKAAFQVFYYSYLFHKTSQEKYEKVEPGLFNSQDLFGDAFRWQLEETRGSKNGTPVSDFQPLSDRFEELLTQLLTEIWDKDVPFDQVQDERKCMYCPYKEICSRTLTSNS